MQFKRSTTVKKVEPNAELNVTLKLQSEIEDGVGFTVEDTVQSNIGETTNNVVVMQQRPAHRVFQTFETAANLSDGLCVIRKLDGGSYEIINFSSIDADILGTKEAGDMIRGDETGSRLKVLEGAEKAWKESGFKIGQALGSAKLGVFRFLKLPIELRFRIYNLTASTDRILHVGSYTFSPKKILPGIQLTATCRQIYEETRRVFWGNNFRVDRVYKEIKPLVPVLMENLRDATFTWWSSKIKDQRTLRMFKRCNKLKVLRIVLTCYALSQHAQFYNPGKQYLYRDEPAADKFKDSDGFDELVTMRGLQLVVIYNHHVENMQVKSGDITEKELKAFEAFLNKKLTRPKHPTIPTYFPVIKEKPPMDILRRAPKSMTKKRSSAACTAQ
ncbi:hypothetical protein EG329_005485 [Mollisiaceae sp. DMI_Dod_QoI]|nr:hypothetical protein EG329_005485 [Helotiales sp. DMI_Dod_QoI]